MKKTETGFTLAEVLLTLTVIGVVAALTIAPLIQSVKEADMRVRWKKAYSVIEQATRKLLVNDVAGSFQNYFTSDVDLRDKYATYLIYTKICNSGVVNGNCWANVKYLDGTSPPQSWFDSASLISPDGSFIQFQMNSSQDCNKTSWWGGLPKCGVILVDVNGLKGPNTFGKDMFGAQKTNRSCG